MGLPWTDLGRTRVGKPQPEAPQAAIAVQAWQCNVEHLKSGGGLGGVCCLHVRVHSGIAAVGRPGRVRDRTGQSPGSLDS